MRTFYSVLLAIIFLTLTGCNGGGSLTYAWYDIFGNYCSSSMPSPGCDYYANGQKVSIWQDPFYYMWPNDGTYWTSPDGIFYSPSGYPLNSQSDSNETADVISVAADNSKQVATAVGKAFADLLFL